MTIARSGTEHVPHPSPHAGLMIAGDIAGVEVGIAEEIPEADIAAEETPEVGLVAETRVGEEDLIHVEKEHTLFLLWVQVREREMASYLH